RIRDAKLDDLPVGERVERIGVVARPDRGVRPESQRVVLIDPGVVRSLGGAVPSRERGAGNRIEGPALRAAIAIVGARAIERALALLAIEARDVAARERHPCHALSVNVEAAHAEAGRRTPVHFSQRRLARVRAELDADDPARMADVRSPDRAVGRTRRDSVEAEAEPLVLGRVLRLTRLDPGVALAVAVGIDDQGRPSLGLPRVARLPEHLRVHPAEQGQLVLKVVAEPQGVVGVLAEVEVVSAEAGVDERELLGPRIVDGDLPRVLHEPVGGPRERIDLPGGMARRRGAVRRWMLGRAARSRVVDAPLVVHHRVVGIDPRVPRESHTCSVPKYGDGAPTLLASAELGASASRTGTLSTLLVILTGSKTA